MKQRRAPWPFSDSDIGPNGLVAPTTKALVDEMVQVVDDDGHYGIGLVIGEDLIDCMEFNTKELRDDAHRRLRKFFKVAIDHATGCYLLNLTVGELRKRGF